jgi:hypothetical protein
MVAPIDDRAAVHFIVFLQITDMFTADAWCDTSAQAIYRIE